MPDQFSSQFEHETLEADIKALAEEVRLHREKSESKNFGDKELLKMAIRSLPPAGGKSQTDDKPAGASKSPLPDYARSAPADVKLEVEYLLDLAFHKGIGLAISEAKKSSDFVQDVFHDALAGKLYPELQKRGILK